MPNTFITEHEQEFEYKNGLYKLTTYMLWEAVREITSHQHSSPQAADAEFLEVIEHTLEYPDGRKLTMDSTQLMIEFGKYLTDKLIVQAINEGDE